MGDPDMPHTYTFIPDIGENLVCLGEHDDALGRVWHLPSPETRTTRDVVTLVCLPPHVIAEQLGHRDGGKLIVNTYGHPDAAIARRRIRDAYAERGNLRHLPLNRSSNEAT